MANEVYNSSWWGYSDSKDFGSIYNSYGINPLTELYTERVLADAGTIEAIDCVNQIFK
tara:strand:+ start:380 stop:553 length:174 start_codon:yes stop_codon:yes gene_type:complete